MSKKLSIQWCGDVKRAEELADFFANYTDASYISHSEIQGARALSQTEWREPRKKYLFEEIGPRLSKVQKKPNPTKNSKPILIVEDPAGLVGLSFVTFDSKWVPFAMIEDLVVKDKKRSKGIGKFMIDWIADEARKRQIFRLMLESGITNEHAHAFFEREGFTVCSKVMIRELVQPISSVSRR